VDCAALRLAILTRISSANPGVGAYSLKILPAKLICANLLVGLPRCAARWVSAKRPSTCGRTEPSEVRKLRHMQEENQRLKRIVADLSLDREMLREVIRSKL
jgi:putative transposase